MPLIPGTRLGPYEIDVPIGAGGMGEVYRARDTRLDRVVAIKVLREPLAADPAGRERFEREARVVSSLNHPHICSLYDVGPDYLVLEYLEGETLADRIARGAIPVKQAMRIAIQMADALDRAHRAGVVHRDLKPANVFLVGGVDSYAKLLDFGLAKSGRLPGAADPGSLATAQAPLTAAGTILGTFQYMAPEQLEGQEADTRTDVFAFGVVLYEMLSGRRAFDGKTQASLISAILEHDPPPLASFAPGLPPALQHVIDRSIAKHPDARWQSARDIAAELEWIAGGTGAERPVPARRPGPLRPVLGAAAVAALAVASTLWVVHRTEPRDASVLRFDVLTPPNRAVVKGAATPAAQFSLAPDGRRLAYVASDGRGTNVLWVHAFAGAADKTLPATMGASYPFWSSDNRSIAFFADGLLKRIDVETGSIQTICDAPDPRGGAWGPGDTIIVAPIVGDVLYRVSALGGAKTPVTRMDRARNETAHRWPVFLPDGRHFLFLVSRNPDITEIDVGSLDDPRTTALIESPFHAVYGSGHIVFAREGVLFAQPFDPARLALTGTPAIIAPTGIGNNQYHGAFDVSATGILAYAPSSPTISELAWFDRRGTRLETIGSPDDYLDVEISPDGRHVGFARTDRRFGTPDVWIRDRTTGNESRVTFGPSYDSSPLWSSDGKRIVFRSASTGLSDLFIKTVGSDRAEPLLLTDRNKVNTSWSPDGRFIVFHAASPATGRDLWLLPLDGDRTPRPFLASRFNEFAGRVSPDGGYLSYLSDESGTVEVYVTTFPRAGEKWQVSFGGGHQPRWRGDGRELLFVSPDRKMMSAGLRTGGGRFEAARPVALFQTAVPSIGSTYRTDYAVAADGQRFLVISLDQNAIVSLSVTVNWPATLRR